MNRSRLATAALVACLTFTANSALAVREVGAARFEDTHAVAGQNLVLNGAGMRVKMIIKVYAVALYLPRKEATTAGVLAQGGPKRIQIVMLRDVPADKLGESLVDGIKANTTESERGVLQSRIDELEKAMIALGEARKGSMIQLDYLPGTGTRITLSGRPVMRDVPGEDFYRALLKIWLGDKPADGDLRARMLGAD